MARVIISAGSCAVMVTLPSFCPGFGMFSLLQDETASIPVAINARENTFDFLMMNKIIIG